MAPDALGLMESDASEDSVAGICEHAVAWVRTRWGVPNDWRQPGGHRQHMSSARSTGQLRAAAARRQTGQDSSIAWFGWGFGYTSGWENLDDDAVRGSVAMWAGVGFEAKDNPMKVMGNEEWLAERIHDGFHSCWLAGLQPSRAIKYPDELLVATTIGDQGQTLGRWVSDAFQVLADNPPPK